MLYLIPHSEHGVYQSMYFFYNLGPYDLLRCIPVSLTYQCSAQLCRSKSIPGGQVEEIRTAESALANPYQKNALSNIIPRVPVPLSPSVRGW